MSRARIALFFWALLVPNIYALSWRAQKKVADVVTNSYREVPVSPSEMLQQPSRLPNIYALALSELQELESEPLCHRVAARLLVNNCQLVDGKDDATILTDSGRQVRDFVDSYAASLAICDLERGRFKIPSECTKFREPTLSQIAVRNEPQLHVSSQEISSCLSALAASDAAWSTWISYRHKALRFCEAARADHEKAQNILLYQRLTQVIAKLTDGVEAELKRHMDQFDDRARQSLERLEKVAAKTDHLREGLSKVESYLSDDLGSAIKKSKETMNDGYQQAQALQQLMSALLRNVVESNSDLAVAHEKSLAQASRKASGDMEALLAIVTTAAATSISLQQQIETSNRQAAELARRQDALEQGMDRLITVAETLSTTYEDHTHTLKQASNITNELLDTLEVTAATASSVNDSFMKTAVTHSYTPFIVCPVASILFGSYGLPGSIWRNLGLFFFGEAIAFIISLHERFSSTIFFQYFASSDIITNTTTSASSL